ncbi:MAG TPA: DUF6113 family protein [Streptosporangiaceae bacterium]|nr:DUF6113 family protein [Streptosporangiaceae bacterium]
MSEEVRAKDPANSSVPAEPAVPAEWAVSSERPAPAGERLGLDVGPAAPPTRLEAFFSGGAYGVLAVAGAVVGLLGAFYHAVDVGPIPAFAIAFALLNLGAFRLAGWAMGTRMGAGAPALAWLLIVIFMSSRRPEGDLVISGSAAGYVYLLGGSVAAVLAVVRTRSTVSWL